MSNVLGKRRRLTTDEGSRRVPFPGHLCTWCKGTPDEFTRWETHGALVRHAQAVHLREGVRLPTTALYPPAAGLTKGDVTDVLPEHLLWSEFNLPVAMGYLDSKLHAREIRVGLRAARPKVKNEKGQRALPYLLEADGTPAKGPRGDLLYDVAGLPRRISSVCEHWRLEALCRTCPDAVFTDFRDRIPGKKMLEHGAFTNRRKRYRADNESAQGRLKGFVMTTMIDRAGATIPLLTALDALSPRQKDNGTTWDVLKDGLIAQPAPRNLCQGERWDPTPIQVDYPYQMNPVLKQAEVALEKAKATALSKGIHWTELGKDELKEIGIGGKFGTSTSEEKKSHKGDGKYNGKSYRMSEVRQFLRDRGLPDKGNNKRDLIQRLNENDRLRGANSANDDSEEREMSIQHDEDEDIEEMRSVKREESLERDEVIESEDEQEGWGTEFEDSGSVEDKTVEVEAAADHKIARSGFASDQDTGDVSVYSTLDGNDAPTDGGALESPERESDTEDTADMARQQPSKVSANLPNRRVSDENWPIQPVEVENALNQLVEDENMFNQLTEDGNVPNQSANDTSVADLPVDNAGVPNQPADDLGQEISASFPVMANWTNHSLLEELETYWELFEDPVFDLEEDPLVPRWVKVEKGEHRYEPVRLCQVTPEMLVYRHEFFTGFSRNTSNRERRQQGETNSRPPLGSLLTLKS